MTNHFFRHALGGLVFGLGVLVNTSPANAIPILQVNGSGILTGALGVQVGGSLYNVQFVEGSCNSLFNSCNPTDFDFPSLALADAASSALLTQVFIDSVLGDFDSRPELTFGCSLVLAMVCSASTPYAAVGTNVSLSNARNLANTGLDVVTHPVITADVDSSTQLAAVFAVWSPVPEPATITLLGAGLLALVFDRRRRKLKHDLTQ